MTPEEFDRRLRLHILKEALKEIEQRGMAFQDESWWPEFCALQRALKETTP